jgi:hypothetical protein
MYTLMLVKALLTFKSKYQGDIQHRKLVYKLKLFAVLPWNPQEPLATMAK